MCPAQFITLQGDQFIDEHGEPFFPMIMSYYVDYFYTDASVPDPYPTPAQVQALGYGRSSAIGHDGQYGYLLTDGPASILQDLAELKAQGFNTLRFLSNAKPMDSGGMGLEVKRYPTGQDKILLPLESPYLPDIDLNPTLWFHYQRILDVCSLAQTLDMKVLLEPFMNDAMLTVMPGDAAMQDHVALLASLAAFIHTHQVTNLLAYEIYGEPTYEDWRKPPVHTKAQICEIARGWNRALKDFDPDHLTTIGGVFFDDVLREGWDPLLLEVDFASMHLYPIPSIYEWTADPNTHLDKAYERYLGLLHWYDRHLNKPYIVSETGFEGEEPVTYPGGIHHPWLMYPYGTLGNEQDQDDFLRATLPMIRGTRCAGYGWWLMQNSHWNPEPPLGPDPPPLHTGADRYYGLLKYGDPTTAPGTTGYENLRKTAAETLVDWASTPPADATYQPPASLDMDHRYYNPYMHPENNIVYAPAGQSTRYGTITGQVKDDQGLPIPGAVVKGAHYIGLTNATPPLPILYGYYTYTDDQGDFEIRAMDPLPGNHINPLDPNRERAIENLDIGAHASSWEQRGWNGQPLQQSSSYVLNSLRREFDVVLDQEMVWGNETRDYKGLATLTAHEVVVIGEATLKARYSVHLLPGFHALEGGECHVFTEAMHLDCDDIEETNLKAAPSTPVPAVASVTQKQLEREVDLAFHVKGAVAGMRLYPNPSRGRLVVELLGSGSELATEWEIQILNATGQLMVARPVNGPMTVFDASSWPAGTYTVQANIAGIRQELRFVKQ